MGAAAWAVYGLARIPLRGMSERLAMAGAMVIVAIAAAVVVYVVMIGLTRAVTMEDMALIPHGEKLGRILHLHALDETPRRPSSGSTRRSASRGGAHLKKERSLKKNILPGKRVIFAKKIRKTGRLPNFLLRYGKKYDRVFGRTKKTLFLR